LAKLLLAHNAALQLGLFVTGCSPGGGASNMWTYVLGGNLNLSITMTCLSTLAAFGTFYQLFFLRILPYNV
jgi:solute carrier family 10 (sodium/bile acid cotransporter), member 3/5